MPKRLLACLVFVVSLLLAGTYNIINLQAMLREIPKKLHPDGSIKTPDDNAYLAPAINYLRDGVWKELRAGKQAYFLRTPGYGLFRFSLLKIFGDAYGMECAKWFQLFLFALSCTCLFETAMLLKVRRNMALTVALVYGASPFACGFVFYNVTESITPALIIFITYSLLKAYMRISFFWLAVNSLLFCYVLLVRPVLGFFLLPYVYVWFRFFAAQKHVLLLIMMPLLIVSGLVAWVLRNYQLSGKWVGLHPIYYADNNSPYRPTHQALWLFQRLYGTDITVFHQQNAWLWRTALTDSQMVVVHEIANSQPAWVKEKLGEEKLRQLFLAYSKSIATQRTRFPTSIAMPDSALSYEREVVVQAQALQHTLQKKAFARCWLVVPLLNLYRIAAHSNLSLYIFQHTLRGLWWMEIMRVFFLLLHACCMAAPFLLSFSPHNHKLLRIMALAVVLYILFLAVFFRSLEERYTLPFLAVGLLCAALWVQRILRLATKRGLY